MKWVVSLAVVGLLALAGGAGAASLVDGGDVKNNSLTGKDVRNRSLTQADFRGSVRGPRGPRGLQGPQGPVGPSALGQIVSFEASATVPAGTVDGVSVSCDSGQGVIGGAFRSTGADSEVFFSDSFGSTTTWSVGLDNFDSSIEADVTAVVFCAPRGVAATPAAKSKVRDRIERAIAAQRATH